MRTSPRRRAREFVLQGLYQRQLSGNPGDAIRAQLAEAGGFSKADEAYFDVLWAGVTAEYDPLVALLAPYLDRRAAQLSPIERAILVIGAWELAAQTFTRDTGIAVAMVRKPTGEVFAQLRAERDNPKADVWYGGTFDSFLQGAAEGLFAPYRSPRLPELYPWAQRQATATS